MIATGVLIREGGNILKRIIQGFDFIRSTNVYVGIPQEKNSSRGAVSNAELLYIHTNGSPAHNIPARPTIEPALSKPETAKQIQDLIISGMKKALFGNLSGAEAEYNRAGIVGMTAAQAMFGSAELAPNAPYTIKKKGSSAPLIDTGSLRANVTYVIRKGGK